MSLARYSARELAHHPLRTALGLLGVAVATAMLVDMLMLGGGIERSFGDLLASRGYELRIAPRGTLPFDTETLIPGFGELERRIEAEPGVVAVAPVLAANLWLERPAAGDRPLRVFALGIDPERQGVLRIVDGRAPRSGEVLLSSETADLSGLAVGDRLRIARPGALGTGGRSARYRVAGTAAFVYASREERPLAMPIEDLRALVGAPDRVSFAMVALDEGADPAHVAGRLGGALPRVEVVTVGGLVERTRRRLSYFRQLAAILGTVSLFVTVLLVGTLMAVSINERYGTIAALRAIGISRGSILAAFAAESLVLCALGGLAGVGLGLLTAGWLESILSDFPGLPRAVRFFVLRPGRLAAAYGILLASGALAALVPACRAVRLEIATTLHAEEP